MTTERTVTICNQRGLHARASAKFVAEAARYDADISVSRDHEQVSADSIMELLMLAAGPGVQITIKADGDDAAEAVDALSALVECGFDEND
ncbi:HPr family phosphocarrier protein [Oceanicaulis alexandrii]|uniref:HPr family phosphocarrier protein n=1 Tax=Oceanicaulis TaxID=153232 RepID=UPI0003B70599|nr:MULTISPECIES: HPr family phosphocarrier protein [Oceanicaulis]MBL4537705.1 HPr family phosphocarrier protein [Oceanicaulis sp.]VXC93499.1 Phosphocarrier protein NPr [Oceanicaulis sp. 350]HCR65282.1 HPr family phosphocarrier protein [Oceanicaulis sp.]